MVLLLTSTGCNRADQERAREKADEARDKTAAAAKKLGTEAEAKAKELNKKLGQSLDGRSGGGTAATESPEEKLHQAAVTAREEGRVAGKKLDYAGMLATVKAKLANDVGLSTVANVDVDVNGSVVTLTGHVSSDDQKRQAEQAVSNVDGVTRVVNQLTISQ